ncbi:hypothetical protein B0T26DRAFT_119760 [Lasiosphaeria miniovina]|uniref:Uncharacterized protein n=1 Tax=Lasiosphaeria miniovina TaxID=1954250 RepID=A0AA40E3Z3_9PEZI|nr:uncharacterized protein B0T26DRAFT_119760 [Lasiosphaeria miniovina]KAK0727174.1 hypothetical protein B0T26DRAFT_119760 [Lasiosphaeria miniovina]
MFVLLSAGRVLPCVTGEGGRSLTRPEQRVPGRKLSLLSNTASHYTDVRQGKAGPPFMVSACHVLRMGWGLLGGWTDITERVYRDGLGNSGTCKRPGEYIHSLCQADRLWMAYEKDWTSACLDQLRRPALLFLE